MLFGHGIQGGVEPPTGCLGLVFWVRIRLGGREYLGVRDTGATISIAAKKPLPCGDLKNILPTAAIRMGVGHVVQSCGDGRSKCLWVLEVLPIGST